MLRDRDGGITQRAGILEWNGLGTLIIQRPEAVPKERKVWKWSSEASMPSEQSAKSA